MELTYSPDSTIIQTTTESGKYHYATVIGGVISGLVLAGISIATSVIASSVANWASVVGLVTSFAAELFSGYIQYDMYRTTSPVSTGYGSYQTAYRYQNIRSIATLKGKSMNILLKDYGTWWFSQKPY